MYTVKFFCLLRKLASLFFKLLYMYTIIVVNEKVKVYNYRILVDAKSEILKCQINLCCMLN